MPERTFKLNISTPERSLFEGEASSLVAPGELGYFGVLFDHAPLIAGLVPGRITIKGKEPDPVVFKCTSTGIMEVLRNNVSILVDSAEKI